MTCRNVIFAQLVTNCSMHHTSVLKAFRHCESSLESRYFKSAFNYIQIHKLF